MSHETIVLLAVLAPSVILHEVAHGVVALAFGDDTAKKAGRLTLNPIAHVDPIGTIVLPLMLAFTAGRPFGWAKPVPVNPSRLRNPRAQSLYVSLAGPATNIVLAVAAAYAIRAVRPDFGSTTREVFFAIGEINVVLAAFNLIPLPPLDGSAIIERFLPRAWWPQWSRLREYSMGIVLIVVLLLPDLLRHVFDTALDLWLKLTPTLHT